MHFICHNRDPQTLVDNSNNIGPIKTINFKEKKRTQVKRACINCRKQHTGCDVQRPCGRCTARNIGNTCFDVPRAARSISSNILDSGKAFFKFVLNYI